MANNPLALHMFPDEKDRKRIVAAITTSAGAAGGVVTLTIPNEYPPIDRTIPSPVIAIIAASNVATIIADENLIWALGGQMGATPASLTPDSAGEFLITGQRTIDVWEIVAGVKVVLIVYVSKGSGQET